MKSIFFISGLPRSGSTLLSAILRQNPRFMAGISSPVSAMVTTLRTMMSQQAEITSLVDDGQREHILRGVIKNYYHHATPDSVVFDTSRSWAGRLDECLYLFPGTKFILTLRDPAWIFDSIERIVRTNPLRQSKMVSPTANIEQRLATMTHNSGIIGGPLGNVKEAVFGPHADRLLLVEYDALCADPKSTMDGIYEFIEEVPFGHRFDYVSYQEDSFDTALQTPGLHTVEGPVRQIERKTILPPEIFTQLSAMAFWKRENIEFTSQILMDERY